MRRWIAGSLLAMGGAAALMALGFHPAPRAGTASAVRAKAKTAPRGVLLAPRSRPRAPGHGVHTIRAGPMSVSVPASWAVTGESTVYGATTWTVQGVGGMAQLTETPLAANNDFQLLPMIGNGTGVPDTQVLYQAETSGPGGGITASALGASGTLYGLSVSASSAVAGAILKSFGHPPAATVTEAVNLIRKVQGAGLPGGGSPFDYALSFGTASDAWLLVGGEPATAQQPFYLFRTVNAGVSWTLERYTTWTCASASCEFLDGAGTIGMAFWNAEDGVVVEGFMATPAVGVYRTQDGGASWSFSKIPLPAYSEGVALTNQGEALTLSVQLFNHAPVVEHSADGGGSWVS